MCHLFRSFPPQPHESQVSLLESVHLVSQGTTGLCTWQVALLCTHHICHWSVLESGVHLIYTLIRRLTLTDLVKYDSYSIKMYTEF